MDLLNTFYLTQQLLPVFFFFESQPEKTAYIRTYIPVYRYMSTTMQVPDGISTDNHL